MELNLEAVQQYIEQNKESEEVKSYLGQFSTPTTEGVKSFLDTDEGKKLLQPTLDSYFTKGLETWKKNNLQKLVDAEVAKKQPNETPEQKSIRELQNKLEEMEREKTYGELKNKALSIATEKKIPVSLIDFFIGENEELTTENLKKFEEAMNTYIQGKVEERIKSSSYTPASNTNQSSSTETDFISVIKKNQSRR